MLEVKNISKLYQTDEVELKALDKVSVNLRQNEFVSILGPSGSGKTTLLNIIGGLDHYTSGDLIIEGISTKDYTAKDWDSYRNHRVGFVFQSYNLIGHQSILQNVELALTLSGVSGAEKKRRAEEALKEVGLGSHMNKRPSQLSGGQMQRVAIARALVNNPDIILADEPTGALDSKTSVQIMEILKKVSKDRLVVMVTHNPELAKEYSSRIITVKDGQIIGDTNPYKNTAEQNETKRPKHTSLSLPTALSLSFNNLLTKGGRTFLTAFAGSIGIIGIALILALANGINDYAGNMVGGGSIPSDITVNAKYNDYVSISYSSSNKNDKTVATDDSILVTDDMSSATYVTQQDSVKTNDTAALKAYIEQNKSKITDAVNTIKYDYGVQLNIYDKDADGNIIKVNPVQRTNIVDTSSDILSALGSVSDNTVDVETITKTSFSEIISDKPYEILNGELPDSSNELLLVVNQEKELPLTTMYSLNLIDRTKLNEIITQLNSGIKPTFNDMQFNYADIVGKTYRVTLPSNNSNLTDEEYSSAKELKVVGVAKVKNEADTSGYMGYTHALVEEIVPESQKVAPKAISFYAKTNQDKDTIKSFLDTYNDGASAEQKVHYVDQSEEFTKALKNIVNIISVVLIGFVAISLVVSSIMIGIITYISVLERTKEIGILRAIGASKRDVVRVFRAETIIEGLVAGLLGISISALICMLVNIIVSNVAHIENIANLSIISCIALVVVSVALTVLAGAIPASKASKKDPVESLRTE